MFGLMQLKKNSTQRHVITIVIATTVVAWLFFLLNYYTPLYGDDYSYSFSFLTGERMESVYQIFSSQLGHYQNINGRSITHSLAQLFLMIGDKFFNYINVVFFLLLMYVSYFHSCGTFRGLSIRKLSMFAMLLFLSCPAFGQSFLWITGAANYLYGILIILCFLIPYRVQIGRRSKRYSMPLEITTAIMYFFLGIIAGWTNENTAVAMIAMIIGYIILFYVKNIKIHAWNITGCVGGVIGCFLMLTAPGTSSRLDDAGGSGNIVTWVKRAIFYSCDMCANIQLPLLIFSCLIILYFWQKRNGAKPRSWREMISTYGELGITLVYLLGFLASVYSMIASPQFPERAWSGPVTLFLITLLSLDGLVDFSDIKARMGKLFIFGFVLLLCMTTYINAFYELKNINHCYQNRVNTIETAVLSGEESVQIPAICGGSGYSCYGAGGDLRIDSSKWPNTAIAKYYGLDEVIRSDE